MTNKPMVLCACSAYEHKYYYNEIFYRIPQRVKDDLKAMCVMFTEDVGGELIMTFSEEGCLNLHVRADEGDLLFDEIGSDLKIKKLRYERRELFMMLENYYNIFYQNSY